MALTGPVVFRRASDKPATMPFPHVREPVAAPSTKAALTWSTSSDSVLFELMNEPEESPPSAYEPCGAHLPATPPLPPGSPARIRVTANFQPIRGFDASKPSGQSTTGDGPAPAGRVLRPPPRA